MNLKYHDTYLFKLIFFSHSHADLVRVGSFTLTTEFKVLSLQYKGCYSRRDPKELQLIPRVPVSPVKLVSLAYKFPHTDE